MPVRRDPSADYPVLNAGGEVIVQEPYDGYTPGSVPRDPGQDYPVFDGNGQVIIATPYGG